MNGAGTVGCGVVAAGPITVACIPGLSRFVAAIPPAKFAGTEVPSSKTRDAIVAGVVSDEATMLFLSFSSDKNTVSPSGVKKQSPNKSFRYAGTELLLYDKSAICP